MDAFVYTRSINIEESFDIIVCGGGPAGFSAAIQAARLGARTALFEASGMLGGALTLGGNTEIALFYARGRQIIRGIGWEFVTRLAAAGWARIPDFTKDVPHSALGVSVNGPMAAQYLDAMCEEAKVQLFFHQPGIDVMKEGRRVVGIIVPSKAGLQAYRCKVLIDCTGDGDMAAAAGADFELGGENGELQPGTLRFYPSGFDIEDIDKNQVDESFARARAAGVLQHGDYWPEPKGSIYQVFRDMGNNINHVHPVNGADSRSVAAGEIAGRASVARIAEWARKNVHGAERFEPFAVASQVCLRESRRILGDAYVTAQEYADAKRYGDAVCYAYYPIDLHRGESDGVSLDIRHLQTDRVPTIPLGALRPKGLGNVLVAGRCLSADRLAHSALRVKAPCTAMGQASGAAAVLSLEHRGDVRAIDVERLRGVLKDAGAMVPD